MQALHRTRGNQPRWPDDRGLIPHQALADAARLATSITSTAYGAVTLLDEDWVWFAAASGLDAQRIKRSGSFCDRVVTTGERFVVADASIHPEFRSAPFVVGDLVLRFYAGLPLTSRSGQVVGTLCVADGEPDRPVTEDQYRHLALLADVTLDRLEQAAAEIWAAKRGASL